MKYLSMLLAFILIFTQLIPSPGVSASGFQDSDTASPAYTLLSDLDIIDSSDYNPAKPVTRAEFCALISTLLSVSDFSSSPIPFDDVDESHIYYDDICIAYDWGIISASSAFRPDDNITSTEAAKMAVTTLGYDFLANSKGGWPAGYVAAAASLKLDVASDFTYEAAVELAYDMLKCKLPTFSIVNSNLQYYSGEGDTLLQMIWGLECITAKVTDGQYFGLTKSSGAGYNSVIIGGYSFDKGSFDTDMLIGETVDAYYNSKHVLCSVYSHNELDSSCEIVYSPQDISYANGVYEYYSNKTQKTEQISISPSALIIYNGKNAVFDTSIMVPENGYVKLIKNSSGQADIVIIKSYEQIVAGEVIIDEELVSNVISNGTSYSLYAEHVNFYNQDGEKAYITDISANDILWMAKSSDGELLDVIICKDIIIGAYTGMSSSGDYVFIDNAQYSIGSYATNQLTSELVMGEILTGHITPYGEIAYFEKAAGVSDKKTGYLMVSSLFDLGLEKEINLKILNTEGTVETYKLVERFTINGKTFKDDTLTNYTALPKQSEKPDSMQTGIVTYYVNDEGMISSINYSDETASVFGGKKTGLYKTAHIDGYDDSYVEYKQSGSWITAKSPERLYVKSTTVFFVVPRTSDINDAIDEDYRVTTVSSFANGEEFKSSYLTGYTASEDGDVCDYVVQEYVLSSASQSVSTTSSLYMVENLSVTLDKDKVPKATLTVRNSSSTVRSFYSEDINYFNNLGLKFGDLVKLSADTRGDVKGVLIVYRPGETSFKNQSTFDSNGYTGQKSGSVLTNNTGMGAVAGSYVVAGNIYKKGSRSISVLPFNTSPDAYNGEALHGYTLKDIKFLQCNLETETIESGNAANIKSYENFGSSCSVAVVETRSGHISSMFIYN